MFSPNTLKILDSITNINNSIVLEYPITSFKNQNGDIMCNIDFTHLESEEWTKFGIFDLSSFLNAISILDKPEIHNENGIITATDSNSEIRYLSSDPETLSFTVGNARVVDSTMNADSVAELKIDTKIFQKIRKGATVFKNLKDLIITNEEIGKGGKGELKFITGNYNSGEFGIGAYNSYTINFEQGSNENSLNGARVNRDFTIAIPIENFLALPPMEYTMAVKYNSERDSYRVTFFNEIFKFVLAIKI